MVLGPNIIAGVKSEESWLMDYDDAKFIQDLKD